MPLLEFENGELVSVKIKAVELGFYGDKAYKGLPHEADPEVTQEIFETLCRLSVPYGTKLKMEDGMILLDM